MSQFATPARLGAEFLGTFWLVLGGCGTAVLAAGEPAAVGALGVALAFGLTVVTMAYAVGHVSGAHFNPAVTVGLAVARRFSWREVPAYVITQVVAAVAAAAVLLAVASGRDGFSVSDGFATNGFGDSSPGGYSLLAALIVEVVATAFFVYVILGATGEGAPAGFAPLAIGLALTLAHFVTIPVTNASLNPARSTGPALFAGTEHLGQLWLFWVAPLAGAALAGATHALLTGGRRPAGTR
ncbi:MAG: aquaporin Z [Actinomycetales bacterium]|nr:aquaporin Z [Actinomycetales bacterium]